MPEYGSTEKASLGAAVNVVQFLYVFRDRLWWRLNNSSHLTWPLQKDRDLDG